MRAHVWATIDIPSPWPIVPRTCTESTKSLFSSGRNGHEKILEILDQFKLQYLETTLGAETEGVCGNPRHVWFHTGVIIGLGISRQQN
jgi:hypothetical protein